jgi:transposase
LDRGLSFSEVAAIFDLDDSTIYRYAEAYNSNPLEQYLSDSYVAYQGKLNEAQKAALAAEVEANFYLTAKQVSRWIQDTYSIQLSPSAVARLLDRLGFSYKKTKLVPAKADAAKQEAHIKDFEALMANKPVDTLVFFNDGVHPQHNTRSEYAWIRKGKEYEMPSNPGRNRLNITGAVNAEEPTEVVVVEQEMVNSQSTILVWEEIEEKHPDKQIIHFCDNAAYYKSSVIKEWLDAHPRTTVRFLPPYSPNLNPIERLWKFMKKKVTANRYFEEFDDFKKNLMEFFRGIRKYRSELRTLITDNFSLLGT